LTPTTRLLAKSQKPIGVVATKKKMKLLRWNNARPKPYEGKPSASHNGEGLEVAKSFSTSGRGEKISLDIPLYRSGHVAQNPPNKRKRDISAAEGNARGKPHDIFEA
jgi:hypothetical protein